MYRILMNHIHLIGYLLVRLSMLINRQFILMCLDEIRDYIARNYDDDDEQETL